MKQELAKRLPDLPRWIEVRSMLLSGRCEVLAGPESDDSFVAFDRERELIAVVGSPDRSLIMEAVADVGARAALICPLENAPHIHQVLPERILSPASLHLRDESVQLPIVPDGSARIFSPNEIEALNLPENLKEELRIVAPHCLIGATVIDGATTSFCYVAWETEGLWDLSIETVPEFRGKGHAANAVAFMIDLMNKKDKLPVWGAEEYNIASMRLAAKLGFRVVDRLAVFHHHEERIAW